MTECFYYSVMIYIQSDSNHYGFVRYGNVCMHSVNDALFVSKWNKNTLQRTNSTALRNCTAVLRV
jgi:hypothetical protein